MKDRTSVDKGDYLLLGGTDDTRSIREGPQMQRWTKLGRSECSESSGGTPLLSPVQLMT